MEDRLFCYCLLKRASEVAAAWKAEEWRDVRAFMDETRIGTVCTSCRGELYQLVEAIRRGEVMPVPLANAKQLSSARRPKLTPWKKFKRVVRSALKRREGMRELTFHTIARTGAGWRSSLQLANLANADFPGRTVDLEAKISVYNPDGIVAGERVLSVPAGKVQVVDISEIFNPSSDQLGLVIIRFTVNGRRAAQRWRVGTNRPYMTWTHDGRPLTIHEKSLSFDRPCVLPGVLTIPGAEIDLCLSSITDQPGSIQFRLHSAEKTAEHRIDLGPFASALWTVPTELDGKPIKEIEAQSTIALTGYQIVRNLRSGLMAIQHLVKEGS
jgi:hypothetical protein